MAFVQPTHWQLSGIEIDEGPVVTYSTVGAPVFHYRHIPLGPNLTFTGKEIRVVKDPDVGTLVSVTIFMSVDAGYTTFTVLLPTVNLDPAPGSSAQVITDGITTAHHLAILPPEKGQQEFYSVRSLKGTASH